MGGRTREPRPPGEDSVWWERCPGLQLTERGDTRQAAGGAARKCPCDSEALGAAGGKLLLLRQELGVKSCENMNQQV